MKTFALILTGALAICLDATPSHAQSLTRTFVSASGDDGNTCSRLSPCKTFNGALAKTNTNGEINCVDPGGSGTVFITKSITIDCRDVYASILNTGTNGITINFDAFSDVRRTVRLRNLNFNGTNSGLLGLRIIGGAGSSGSEVFVEDVLIDGNFAGVGRGISDERTGGGKIFITNTTVRNNVGTGIVINPAGGASLGARIEGSIDNVRVQNNGFGISVGSAARIMISRSVVSGNENGGVQAEGPFSQVEVNVDDSVISHNDTGIQVGAGTVVFRLSNNNIAFNGTGISGATQSFTSNRISGNGSAGMAPTAIAPSPTNPSGQQ